MHALQLDRPLLLYDGDCAFCAYWVRYWQRLTGTRVDYRPYQDVIDQLPGIDAAECRRAVQLLEPDGTHSAGAAASFRVLARGGHPMYAALYSRSTAGARVAEWIYTCVSRRRAAAHAVARLLWGRERYPARYAVANVLFLRAIALTYVAAFASLATQVVGLLGAQGIAPVADLLPAVARAYGSSAWFAMPSIFWLAHGDAVLSGACWVGAGAACLAALCATRPRIAWALLAVCYVLYLSLFAVGQDFMSFQWDLLLLEAGFLALWLPSGSPLIPWLFRLLLFRFMFLSGSVKLLSGDPNWAALTALNFHYETQPLPTPLAWYAHQLPAWFDRWCVIGTFVVELGLPFLIFTPRRPRMLAASGFLLLETLILLTGNYNFFNLLTIALCVFLFDDAQFRRVSPALPRRGPWTRPVLGAFALVMVLNNAYCLLRPYVPAAIPAPLTRAVALLAPLRIVNPYGLFAVMTTTRPEIDVQGSDDGRHWQSYGFRYKPGDPHRALRWNIPGQPRLDWQMWFAALTSADDVPWFSNFLVRLLHDAQPVTGLLAANPFPDHPPRYVRALLWQYRFTTPAERAHDGAVWERQALGLYYPAVRLH